MTDVCFYFQVHQPIRLRRLHLFNMPQDTHYWDDAKNRAIFDRVSNKCYVPTNKMLLELIKEHPEFKVSFSLSGTFVEQAKQFRPDVMDLFRDLADTGRAEFLDETYYHSLAGLWEDQTELKTQIQLHRDLMEKELGVTPTFYRNTELIYDDRIARTIESLGYQGIATEGTEKILGWRSPNFVYKPAHGDSKLKVLLKNYRLSDDIAFRFSTGPSWPEWPLTAPKFADWLAKQEGDTIDLFMDYETFGEHNWPESGIFDFLRHMPGEAIRRGVRFATPSEVVTKHDPVGTIDVPFAISWADSERDVSAWLHNEMQQQAFNTLRELAPYVKELNDPQITHAWRLLQTSDHVYYCTTKHMGDQDIHMYFSPYDSPYQAFINLMNVIVDLKHKIFSRLRR
ncbi:MAG TPA: glycoside hydrolase family 57 protein [Candidatus Thermoplasmatota archaeon]|nr:glycoside hydrolase family 57 protein [Candidatus Thermoplasmatota archaeon]